MISVDCKNDTKAKAKVGGRETFVALSEQKRPNLSRLGPSQLL